jgi:transposase
MTAKRKELQSRRLRAARDIRRGASSRALLQKYRISRTTLARWRHAVAAGESLCGRIAGGRPRRLDWSWIAALWRPGLTHGALAALVAEACGVAYDADHVGRIVKRLGLRADGIRGDGGIPQVIDPEGGSGNDHSSQREEKGCIQRGN